MQHKEKQLTHLLAVLELLHPETSPLEAAAVSQVWEKHTTSFSHQERGHKTQQHWLNIQETVRQNNTQSLTKVEM